MAEPLHPLRGNFDVAVVSPAAVLDDSSPPACVEGVFEFPECVAFEVEAYEPFVPPWKVLHLPIVP